MKGSGPSFVIPVFGFIWAVSVVILIVAGVSNTDLGFGIGAVLWIITVLGVVAFVLWILSLLFGG